MFEVSAFHNILMQYMVHTSYKIYFLTRHGYLLGLFAKEESSIWKLPIL